jgi:hypothetical protein
MFMNPLPIPVPAEETEYLNDLNDVLEHLAVSPQVFFDAALRYATGEGQIPDAWFEYPKTLPVVFMTVRLINHAPEYLLPQDQLRLSCISACLEVEQLIADGVLTPAEFADHFQTVARLLVKEGRSPTGTDDLGPAANALYLIAQMLVPAVEAKPSVLVYVMMMTDLIRVDQQKPRDLIEYLRDCILIDVYGVSAESPDLDADPN